MKRSNHVPDAAVFHNSQNPHKTIDKHYATRDATSLLDNIVRTYHIIYGYTTVSSVSTNLQVTVTIHTFCIRISKSSIISAYVSAVVF